MQTKPHIAVVGAGIVGICSAYFLQKTGFQVTLIDKNEPGSMTSYGHACTFADYACVPVNSPNLFREIPSMLLKNDGLLSVDFFHVLKNLNWTTKFLQNCTTKKVEYISNSLSKLIASFGQLIFTIATMVSSGITAVLSVATVIIPKVPSEPIKRFFKS